MVLCVQNHRAYDLKPVYLSYFNTAMAETDRELDSLLRSAWEPQMSDFS